MKSAKQTAEVSKSGKQPSWTCRYQGLPAVSGAGEALKRLRSQKSSSRETGRGKAGWEVRTCSTFRWAGPWRTQPPWRSFSEPEMC